MENHVNAYMFTEEQLRQYQLAVQAHMAQLAIYNEDCQKVWDEKYPQE